MVICSHITGCTTSLRRRDKAPGEIIFCAAQCCPNPSLSTAEYPIYYIVTAICVKVYYRTSLMRRAKSWFYLHVPHYTRQTAIFVALNDTRFISDTFLLFTF